MSSSGVQRSSRATSSVSLRWSAGPAHMPEQCCGVVHVAHERTSPSQTGETTLGSGRTGSTVTNSRPKGSLDEVKRASRINHYRVRGHGYYALRYWCVSVGSVLSPC